MKKTPENLWRISLVFYEINRGNWHASGTQLYMCMLMYKPNI